MRLAARSLKMTLAVMALTCLFVAAARADDPRANNAAGSARLKYLPKDYVFVGELDIGTIMQAMANANWQQQPQAAQFKQALQLVESFTGIDLENDLQWVTVFVTNKGDKPAPLVVVQGKFDIATVEKKLSGAPGVSDSTYKNRKVYTFSEFNFFFPEASTIVGGDEELVHKTIDQLDGKPRPLPTSLKAVLERTPGDRLMWAAVQPKTLLEAKELDELRTANGELFGALKQIECMSLSFDLADDGIAIKGLGYAATPAAAKSAYQYLSDRKRDLLHKEGVNVVFASLLIFSELKNDGQFVDGSFRLTAAAIKELWETKFVVRPEKRGGSGK